MIKKAVVLLAIITLLSTAFLCVGCSDGQNASQVVFTVDGVQYLLTDGENKTVRIISYTPVDDREQLFYYVPVFVDYQEVRYTVTEIGDGAYMGLDAAFISLPGVKSVGNYAFAHGSVQELYLSVQQGEKIGVHAFADCLRMQKIHVLTNVLLDRSGAGENAFSYFDRGEKKYKIYPGLTLSVPEEMEDAYRTAWGDVWTIKTNAESL